MKYTRHITSIFTVLVLSVVLLLLIGCTTQSPASPASNQVSPATNTNSGANAANTVNKTLVDVNGSTAVARNGLSKVLNPVQLTNAGIFTSATGQKFDCANFTQPVCSIHNVTYQNYCFSRLHNDSYVRLGVCGNTSNIQYPLSGVCPAQLSLVCGNDGNTYANDCFALNSGVSVMYYGDCRQNMTRIPKVQGTACDNVHAYVCGNKMTFQNSCVARAHGVLKTYNGTCNSVQVSCDDTGFVCGKDGISYSGACFAKSLGVDVAHTGLC